MRLTVGLDSRDVPEMWLQAERDWVPAGGRRDDGEWPAAAHDAMQRGIESLRDRLDGVGIDEADLQLRVVRSDQEADVRVTLAAGGRSVVRNRVALDLAEALDAALRELGRAVDDGALDAAPTPSGVHAPGASPQVPWRLVTDSAHQYAQHCVTNAIRRGDLSAGRVEPGDLAELALSEQLEDDRTVRDLPAAMRALCVRIEELLGEEIARLAGEIDVPLDAPEPDDGPEVVQDEPVDTGPSQVADHLGIAPDLDDRIDHADERHRLTSALFDLNENDRVLFVEFASEGFSLDVLAAARGEDPARLARRLRGILRRLADEIGLDPEDLLLAYRALGEVLRDERRVVEPYGLGPPEVSVFE